MRVTQTGHALLKQAEGSEQMLAGIERRAAGLRKGAWDGSVRVSATEPVISEILAPQIPRLIAIAPKMRIDLVVENTLVSLARHDADIAIRLVRPEGDSLMARRLPPLGIGLYASRAYLEGRSEIGSLRAERFIGYDDTYGRIPEVRWISDQGLDGALAVRTSSTRGLLNAVSAGAGIAILPRFLARRQPHLIELPAPVQIPSRIAWLVWHRDLKRSSALRQLRQWVAESFAIASGQAPGSRQRPA